MPLVWLCRLKGHEKVQRVYGPDLMLALCGHSIETGFRHYFFGGAVGVPEKLSANLRNLFPGLIVTGIYSPPFRPMSDEEDRKIIEIINSTEPDIVWIGLSTPKQERWMAEHIDRLTAPVLIGVGAAFDFLAGSKKQAPRWMQRSGMEWFFRLITEPRRLWRRYLINNPAFLWLVMLQTLGIKEYSLE
jgi:N-acetylglucosaminyldiphosphoundecaprenol N-acetyl-beta-D-mannosaminyltransferase